MKISSEYISRAERVLACEKAGHPDGVEHDWFCLGIHVSKSRGQGLKVRGVDWSASEHGRLLDPVEPLT